MSHTHTTPKLTDFKVLIFDVYATLAVRPLPFLPSPANVKEGLGNGVVHGLEAPLESLPFVCQMDTPGGTARVFFCRDGSPSAAPRVALR